MFLRIALLAAIAASCAAAPARAQDGVLSADAFSITGDARIVAADGERSWIDGGLGKTRFDDVGPQLAEADLIWQPRFSWSLSGTVIAIAQRGQDHPLDISEAALTFKPMLPGPAKLSVRAGLYWPAISLEHSGPEWAVTETITPSAINSWIGDEIKTGGMEATVTAPLGSHRLSGTLGLFGLNDTSGTLLAFRGWALHDQKATAFGLQPLPPRDPFMTYAQAAKTRPVIELDNRVGWYGKLGWSPSDAFELQFFHYDNRGNPEAVTSTLQWGWRTHFNNLGAVFAHGKLTLKAQAMDGRTEMGFPMAGRIWVDTRFRSAFLLATYVLPKGSVSARMDAFGTRSHGSVTGPAFSEDGWAVTLAARRELGPHLSLLAEYLYVDSDKADRLRIGLPAHQRQNQFQIAFRVRY